MQTCIQVFPGTQQPDSETQSHTNTRNRHAPANTEAPRESTRHKNKADYTRARKRPHQVIPGWVLQDFQTRVFRALSFFHPVQGMEGGDLKGDGSRHMCNDPRRPRVQILCAGHHHRPPQSHSVQGSWEAKVLTHKDGHKNESIYRVTNPS